MPVGEEIDTLCPEGKLFILFDISVAVQLVQPKYVFIELLNVFQSL